MRIIPGVTSQSTADTSVLPVKSPGAATALPDASSRDGETNRGQVELLQQERPAPRTVRTVDVVAGAGVSNAVATDGASRVAGPGITDPVAPRRAGLSIAPDAYANLPLNPERADALAHMRVAIAADHGAWEQAHAVAAYVRELGAAEVQVFAPSATGETLYYSVAGTAALQRLEAGRVDRVIALCGNGFGVLDVANQFAEEIPGAKVTRPPVYADNFWAVVDSQRAHANANVMCMGARLLAVDDNPARAFVKAFFDDPKTVDALASNDAAQHGIATTLVDPKPERVAKRKLEHGLEATLALSDKDRQVIRAARPIIYYQAGNPTAHFQARALDVYLRPFAKIRCWDGPGAPPSNGHLRVIYLADGELPGAPEQPRGFWRPPAEEDSAVYRADLARRVSRFARSAPHDALTLHIPCASLLDEATGGEHNDVLRLFAKVFLTAERSDKTRNVKALYGKAVQFVSAILRGSPAPADTKEWQDALVAVQPR